MVRRKKKIKKLAKIILVIIILITIGISGYFVYNKYFKDEKQVSEVSKLMNEHNIPEDEYSKVLEFVLLNNIYNEVYLNEYRDIEYVDSDNFESILTTFLPKGYSGKEINYITKLSEKNIEKLENIDYVDISNYYNIKNFDVDNIDITLFMKKTNIAMKML